jgi:hypothetical protein
MGKREAGGWHFGNFWCSICVHLRLSAVDIQGFFLFCGFFVFCGSIFL